MHTKNCISLTEVLKNAIEKKVSDVYFIVGKPINFKINGRLQYATEEDLTEECIDFYVRESYRLAERDFDRLAEVYDDDFALTLPGVGRYRVNAYMQKGSYASVIRTIPADVPNVLELNIPDIIVNLANLTRGLVLFTGTTGSGKTTSLACLIDKINRERDVHIVTIEDPIEFFHKPYKSIISQREVQRDTKDFATGLRASLRQAPSVLLVGEMRDQETISTAITAAETGHLVFSTLHTMGAAPTIDRVIDVFPAGQQNQIRTQLAITLQAVITQQLVPTIDGKLRPAFEIMIANTAVRNLVRENKIYQIDNVISTSSSLGMKTMDSSLMELLRSKVITKEQAIASSIYPHVFAQNLNNERKLEI